MPFHNFSFEFSLQSPYPLQQYIFVYTVTACSSPLISTRSYFPICIHKRILCILIHTTLPWFSPNSAPSELERVKISLLAWSDQYFYSDTEEEEHTGSAFLFTHDLFLGPMKTRPDGWHPCLIALHLHSVLCKTPCPLIQHILRGSGKTASRQRTTGFAKGRKLERKRGCVKQKEGCLERSGPVFKKAKVSTAKEGGVAPVQS